MQELETREETQEFEIDIEEDSYSTMMVEEWIKEGSELETELEIQLREEPTEAIEQEAKVDKTPRQESKGEDREEYDEKDLCARMEILMHVSDVISEMSRKMEMAQVMWTHFQTIYEPQNDGQQAHTLQELVNYKMNDEQPVGEF